MRWHLALAAAFLSAWAVTAHAASTIVPNLLPIGIPANAGLINQNFGNAINDVNALQTQNAGVTPPSNPSIGNLWLQPGSPYIPPAQVITAAEIIAALGYTPVMGQTPTVVGDCADWVNTIGTVLGDAGHPCGGPSTGVVSVLDPPYNAACNGVTNDSVAINAALASGAGKIIIPANAICYHASTIVVPDNVTLAGINFAATYPQKGSGLLCAAALQTCVTAGGGSDGTPDVENLSIFRASGTQPSGSICITFNGNYNVQPTHVFCYGSAEGFNLLRTGSGGITFFGDHLQTCATTDADFIQNGNWPEVHVSNFRFGCNGAADVNHTAYVRLAGGGSGAGPTIFQNGQFNIGGGGAALVNCWVQYVGATNANLVYIDHTHAEATKTGICSDSGTTLLEGLSITNSSYTGNWVSTDHFWDQFNSATEVEDFHFSGDIFYGEHWDFVTSAPVFGFTATGNTWYPEVTIDPTGSASLVDFADNRYAFAGAALNIEGTFTSAKFGGVLTLGPSVVSNTASGPVEIDIPGSSLASSCGSSFGLAFGGTPLPSGDYATPPICYWELHGSTVLVTWYMQINAISGSGAATLYGFPFEVQSSIGPSATPLANPTGNWQSSITSDPIALLGVSSTTAALEVAEAGGGRVMTNADFLVSGAPTCSSGCTVVQGSMTYMMKHL
jgi:hypothetical protein